MKGSALVSRVLPSPNWRERSNAALKYVIIHGTWMKSDDEAIARLRDEVTEVSSHYVITRSGELVQLVGEDKSAFHAGLSHWDGVKNLNDWSIGIEIGNDGKEPYTEAEYATLIELLRDIQSRYKAITPHNVLGHDDIAPGRKTDPGKHFDWKRLVSAGVVSRP
ncbi:MAG TPA: N-acetylmuramoyl-L-alanine amidase [Alphaproteobacteria bacterium]|nr:N-acetylmuramoyl-L-alanine amidase [Alphaproteobacteria bacterium]